jgi:hypothetical protein
MLSNIRILLVMAAFFTVADIAYGVWTHLEYGAVEPIGTAAIGLLVIMSIFIAFYLWISYRRAGNLPEDDLNGEISDEAGEVGFFAPWSWWPFALGAFLMLVFASFAVGWWLFYFAAPLALIGLVGFVFEHHRGAWAR